MEKTNVDDMLMEMISPKVTEIQKKFSDGGVLTQDDINTLLLKSQYNHINHLDAKLNEVVADVASLKGEFAGLKGEFEILRGEFKSLEERIDLKFQIFQESMEKTIQQALNKNMMLLVFVMGFFLTLSKIIDKF